MVRKIKFYEMKLNRNELARNIFEFICFIGFFIIIGIVGSFEMDHITMKQFIIRELAAFSLTGISAVIVKIFESRIYYISKYLNKLTHREQFVVPVKEN